MNNGLRTIAFGAALAIAATAVPSLTAMTVTGIQDQDHHDDHDRAQQYQSNPYYQTGNREGYQDHEKGKKRKSHHHKYRSDEDRKAHDAGYDQGWQGQRYDNSNMDHPH